MRTTLPTVSGKKKTKPEITDKKVQGVAPETVKTEKSEILKKGRKKNKLSKKVTSKQKTTVKEALVAQTTSQQEPQIISKKTAATKLSKKKREDTQTEETEPQRTKPSFVRPQLNEIVEETNKLQQPSAATPLEIEVKPELSTESRKHDESLENRQENLHQIEVEAIISNHTAAAMGAAMVPLPIVDIISISTIQLMMVRKISHKYNFNLSDDIGKSIVAALTAGLAPLSISRVLSSLIKVVPGYGSIIGGLSATLMAGAATYATGHVFKHHYECGGTFLNFNPDEAHAYYEKKFKEGQKKLQ